MKNSRVIYREMIEINIDEKCFWTKEQYTKGIACVCACVCTYYTHIYLHTHISIYLIHILLSTCK